MYIIFSRVYWGVQQGVFLAALDYFFAQFTTIDGITGLWLIMYALLNDLSF